ncbi:MAG TPA: DUF4058 family protein [Gemmataceae bacterium]|nr:DUF4058 family protein [Gemmataceae bacterium]
MPLLDHFRPPLSERRPWESLHTAWAAALADALNDHVLPPGYVALEQIHAGSAVEIDVATYCEAGGPVAGQNGGPATATRTVWLPAAPPLVIPATFPPSATVQIISSEGGRTLVAAIELVSPGNKDRAAKRRLFAARCATYLSRGVGLVVVDVVTTRQANMHNELADLLGWEAAQRMAADAALYAVAYRPLRRDGAEQVETWPMPLAVGSPLPVVPLSLAADHCLAVDLEASYLDACRRRRVDEALG